MTVSSNWKYTFFALLFILFLFWNVIWYIYYFTEFLRLENKLTLLINYERNKRTNNEINSYMQDKIINSIDKSVIKIVDLNSKENDFKYWQTQPIEKRLETLEELRIQFIIWKYGIEQGFQRVYRITELT